jgi:hypothetical protein
MPQKPKQIKVLELVFVLVAFPALMFSEQTSTTTAPCSPIAPYNHGVIEIQCKVDSAKTGKQLVEILNRIKESQLSLDLVLKKIDEMQTSVKEIHEQQEFSGFLLPANDPTPKNACSDRPVYNGAMLMILGNSASLSPWFPHIVVRAKGENVLTLNRKNGEIAVGARIFGADGKIIAEIRDNEFSINPNNYFRKERPDKSTLIVYDQEDKKVLDVRFLNPTTVRFLGVLNYPHSMGPLVISDTEGFFASQYCGAYNTIDFNIE